MRGAQEEAVALTAIGEVEGLGLATKEGVGAATKGEGAAEPDTKIGRSRRPQTTASTRRRCA
mgnify:CR=1 FL=1